MNLNQLATTKNQYQGSTKKVLTLCSAGLLRSPTAAHILAGAPWNFNTRAAGTVIEYALIPITSALVFWADEFVCMGENQVSAVNEIINSLAVKFDAEFLVGNKLIHNLNIPDTFAYRDDKLIKILTDKFTELWPTT